MTRLRTARPMDPFLEALKAGFRTCGIAGHHVLLAVSGGADSVAMLRGLLSLRDEFCLRPYVAHLNHQLRGIDSAKDAEWVRSTCQGLDVNVVVGVTDVSERVQGSNRGIEEAARQARYEFLEESAAQFGCSRIAVAHTADDQAETILHHVIRGTGISGLRGMRPVRRLPSGRLLVRPMLAITRASVEDFLKRVGQDHRIDASNFDVQFTRNRVRLRLLPLLEQEFNPQIREALRRLGRQADELQDCMEQLAHGLLERARVTSAPNLCRLKRRPFAGQPRHLIREAFSLLWRELDWPRQQMGFDDWDHLAMSVLEGKSASLPAKVVAQCHANILELHRE